MCLVEYINITVAQEITDLILNNCNIHNNFKTEDEIGI